MAAAKLSTQGGCRSFCGEHRAPAAELLLVSSGMKGKQVSVVEIRAESAGVPSAQAAACGRAKPGVCAL